MAENRMFVSQATLDQWLGDDSVDVVGNVMSIRRLGQRFQLDTAFHFLREVADGGDSAELVGKVKTLDQVLGLGGEPCAGSVILGDNAYEVQEGFLGLPVPLDATEPDGPGLEGAETDANAPISPELSELAQFLLTSMG